jgi:hypothetical protein
MHEHCDLKLLFAARFTAACFSAIRAVAQLADVLRVSVTIAHVGPTDRETSRELHSFFAEADHYESCRRVQLHGPTAPTLAEFARDGNFDLVLAPRSDRVGFPRPFHYSTRAELLRCGATPLWTGYHWLDGADLIGSYRTIAVGIDGTDGPLHHLHLAASLAAAVGAELRLLTVVPAIHEGTPLANAISSEPLSEDVAHDRVRRLLKDWSQKPIVDVAIGSPERELPRMAARCHADLLLLSEAQSCTRIVTQQISSAVDHAPCSVISVPNKLPEGFGWTFQSHAERSPGGELRPLRHRQNVGRLSTRPHS